MFMLRYRELRCFDQSPPDNQYYGSLLNTFNQLHTLLLDLHSDIHYNGRRFAYRDVFTSLPSSLRRLEIRNAHGPDVKIIATVKKYCPDLQELRLGRCNMFNRSPACKFWGSFPFEHDSYISNDGTDEYAPNPETDFNQESCSFCRSEFLQASLDAELSATQTLKSLLPSLSEVQWQGWFTPNHLGDTRFGTGLFQGL
ncbi:hypothetical protein RSAG8_01054, partial [Rhizoctonia solani AG-8 WAC10335]